MVKPAKKTQQSYRELSDELAEILEWFESENLDLDKAVAKYEQALRLMIKIEDHLKTAQNKVKKISARFKL
jgi:exodeoxyribonuclease VII small subunit